MTRKDFEDNLRLEIQESSARSSVCSNLAEDIILPLSLECRPQTTIPSLSQFDKEEYAKTDLQRNCNSSAALNPDDLGVIVRDSLFLDGHSLPRS